MKSPCLILSTPAPSQFTGIEGPIPPQLKKKLKHIGLKEQHQQRQHTQKKRNHHKTK